MTRTPPLPRSDAASGRAAAPERTEPPAAEQPPASTARQASATGLAPREPRPAAIRGAPHGLAEMLAAQAQTVTNVRDQNDTHFHPTAVHATHTQRGALMPYTTTTPPPAAMRDVSWGFNPVVPENLSPSIPDGQLRRTRRFGYRAGTGSTANLRLKAALEQLDSYSTIKAPDGSVIPGAGGLIGRTRAASIKEKLTTRAAENAAQIAAGRELTTEMKTTRMVLIQDALELISQQLGDLEGAGGNICNVINAVSMCMYKLDEDCPLPTDQALGDDVTNTHVANFANELLAFAGFDERVQAEQGPRLRA
jgi:hypothetical protein